MNHYSGSLVGICTAVSRDGVRRVDGAGIDIAVLEDGGGVSEDEVDGSVDIAFPEELSVGMNVECVLVAFEAASVKD